MALTPLTRVQQATVLALVEARRLDVVPTDLARATSFLPQAEERLNQLPLLTSVVVRYGIAYDACPGTGEAMLAAYGFRTTNGARPAQGARPLPACRLRQAARGEGGTRVRPPATRPQPGPLRGEASGCRGDREGLTRSPGRCSTPPFSEGRRGDPAVRKQSTRSPAEADDRRRRPTIPRTRFRSSDSLFRHRPTMTVNQPKPCVVVPHQLGDRGLGALGGSQETCSSKA